MCIRFPRDVKFSSIAVLCTSGDLVNIPIYISIIVIYGGLKYRHFKV